MTDQFDKKERSAPFENVGRRVDEEIEKLISYMNDEVVPSIRSHSTSALRIAADRLSRFADYMEQKQGSPAPPRNQESDQDIGS
ncbi:MAG TPA: hypothetical protein VD837_08090 [Terriglobales bacterium]|nr:hypothetical protein [Terriglobales bacterium]